MPALSPNDWSGDLTECPLSRYHTIYKTTVDVETRRAATQQGVNLPSFCARCGGEGSIAIGKKKTEIGNIYFSCHANDCKNKVERIAELQLSDEALERINSVRALEVTRWLAEEGPEKYFAAIAVELGPLPVLKQEEEEMEEFPPSSQIPLSFTPVPATPPSQTGVATLPPEFLQELQDTAQQLLEKFTPQTPPKTPKTPKNRYELTPFPMDLSTHSSIGSLSSPFSPVPLSSSTIPSRQVSPTITRMKFEKIDDDIEICTATLPALGSKRRPHVLSPSNSPTKTSKFKPGSMPPIPVASTSAVAMGKRKATAIPRVSTKRLKVLSRVLEVIVWYQDGFKPLTVYQTVQESGTFSINDFKMVCDALKVKPTTEFQVWCVDEYRWGPTISPAVQIGHDTRNTVLIRLANVEKCVSFYSLAAQAFSA